MANGNEDLQKMQKDAEQRIRNMQVKANRAVKGYDMPPVPNFVRLNRQEQQARQSVGRGNANSNSRHSPSPMPPAPENQKTTEKTGGFLGKLKGLDILKALNFKNIHIDNDVLLILALIFLMSNEDTDELLLLALVYIML